MSALSHAEIKSPSQAAEIYAASLLAIDVDTEQERQYLSQLAQAMRIDPVTVARLHAFTQTDQS